MNPVTVVVETLKGLDTTVLKLKAVLTLDELLEDMADDTLTGGTVVLVVVWFSDVKADCGGLEPPVIVVVDDDDDDNGVELPLDEVKLGGVVEASVEDDIEDLELEMFVLELLGDWLKDAELEDEIADVISDDLGVVAELVIVGDDTEGHVNKLEPSVDDTVSEKLVGAVGALGLGFSDRDTEDEGDTVTAVVNSEV